MVSATGTSLSYQWYVGTTGNTSSPIGGATVNGVVVAPASTTNYWVRVFGACGTVDSTTATVTVSSPPPTCTAPAITAQPTSRTTTPGQNTTLTVSATGTSLTYQWYVGTTGNTASPIAGATVNGVVVAPTTTTNYWVRVSGACGTVNSTTVTVTVTSGGTLPTAGAAIARDFNGDGRADVLWRNPTTGQNAIWPMSGTNGTTRGADIAVTTLAPPWQVVGAADFNKDAHTDIVWRNTSTGAVIIWLMNRTVMQSSVPLTTVSDLNWSIAGTGDFNSDGFADVIWRNNATGQNEIWLMNGTSLASKHALPAVPSSWRIIGSGQFDRTGSTDLLWRNTAATGELDLWLMNGTSIGSMAALPSSTDQRWQPVAIADYNADGDWDILWRNNVTLQNSLWLMNRTTRAADVAVAPGSSADWTIVGPR
jgi:hypothetical protein